MSTYTIISDTTYFGIGKSHLNDDQSDSSKTLCGIHLGFNYESLPINDLSPIGWSKERILAEKKLALCKRCLKSLK